MIEKYFHEYILRDFKEKLDFDYKPIDHDTIHHYIEGRFSLYSWRRDFNKRIFFNALKRKLLNTQDQKKYMSDLMKELQQEAFEAKQILRQSEEVIKFLANWKPKSTNPDAKVNPKKRKKKEHFNPEDVSEVAFVKKEAKEEKKRKINRWG